jgi:predicted membrane channel-forming protein YqfA (hemolysin III family)
MSNRDNSLVSPPGPSQRAGLKLREPFSGLSHLCGAVLGSAALLVLVSVARGRPWHLSAFAIYSVTLILLYLVKEGVPSSGSET